MQIPLTASRAREPLAKTPQKNEAFRPVFSKIAQTKHLRQPPRRNKFLAQRARRGFLIPKSKGVASRSMKRDGRPLARQRRSLPYPYNAVAHGSFAVQTSNCNGQGPVFRFLEIEAKSRSLCRVISALVSGVEEAASRWIFFFGSLRSSLSPLFDLAFVIAEACSSSLSLQLFFKSIIFSLTGFFRIHI